MTFLTSKLWVSISKFLCITPKPPFCDIDIAILDSVTVSIAADIIGIFKVISLVKFVEISTLLGRILEDWGFNKTSSNVKYSFTWAMADNSFF